MNEAELLFSELLGLNRMDLYQKRTLRLDKARAQEAVSVLKRRISGEPLQYILGKTEFMGLEFKVTPKVLIPRPETELLVEKTIELATKSQSQCAAKRSLPGGDKVTKILDLGTGSGCIAISLAKFLPEAQIDAVDISEEALEIAKENAELNNTKINFIKSDLFAKYELRAKSYELIISNPPYVVSNEISALQPEVRSEPRVALDGGPDGLDFYRRLINDAPRYLREGGYLVLEIGFGQREVVKNILNIAKGLEIMDIIKDYNGIDRVVVTRKAG